MPISATCQRTDPDLSAASRRLMYGRLSRAIAVTAFGPSRATGAGYTLLELLVVLAILGMVTALAVPPLLRTVEAWQRQADIDAVMEQVRGLPMRARSLGHAIVIDTDSLASGESPLRAPEGWTLEVPRPWRVNGNGACEAGELRLASQGREVPLVVHAPFCQPRRPALDK